MNANISGPLISLIVPVYNVKDYLKTCSAIYTGADL